MVPASTSKPPKATPRQPRGQTALFHRYRSASNGLIGSLPSPGGTATSVMRHFPLGPPPSIPKIWSSGRRALVPQSCGARAICRLLKEQSSW